LVGRSRPRCLARAAVAQVQVAQARHLDVAGSHAGGTRAKVSRLQRILVFLAHARQWRLVAHDGVDPVVAAEIPDGHLATRDDGLAVTADGLRNPGVARAHERSEPTYATHP